MQISRVIYPIETLGPGKRIAIWTIGCSKRCLRCISPELWTPRADKDMPVEQIVAFVKKIAEIHPVDGITISGGDPLEQAEELCLLLEQVHPMIHDILVYTGYTLDEAKEILPGSYSRIAQNIGALIDGRYVDELNDSKAPLMGSTNQALHFFDQSLKEKYERYQAGGRRIQNVYFDGNLLSVGIHNREAQ